MQEHSCRSPFPAGVRSAPADAPFLTCAESLATAVGHPHDRVDCAADSSRATAPVAAPIVCVEASGAVNQRRMLSPMWSRAIVAAGTLGIEQSGNAVAHRSGRRRCGIGQWQPPEPLTRIPARTREQGSTGAAAETSRSPSAGPATSTSIERAAPSIRAPCFRATAGIVRPPKPNGSPASLSCGARSLGSDRTDPASRGARLTWCRIAAIRRQRPPCSPGLPPHRGCRRARNWAGSEREAPRGAGAR